MNIPTVHTKAVFNIDTRAMHSGLHFAAKVSKPVNKDIWSHAPLKRANR